MIRSVDRRRFDLVDALRGAALLGVFVINALAYLYVFDASTLGRVVPADSLAALCVHIVAGTFLQAKSYPLLAFLVGYGFALTRRADIAAGRAAASTRLKRRRRTRKQLGLGLVHGTFVYYGDILTNYGLMSLLLLRWLGLRMKPLRRRVAIVACVVIVLELIAASAPPAHPLRAAQRDAFMSAQPWWRWSLLNAGTFLHLLSAFLWLVPWLLLPASLGLFAGRLRWLERDRWQRSWKILAFGVLPIALIANAIHGFAASFASATGNFTALERYDNLVSVIGPALDAGVLGAVAWAHRSGRLDWSIRLLAPLGRISLSAYIGASITMLIVLSTPGLKLAASSGSVGLLAFGVAYWAIALVVAHALERAGRRGPLEAWIAR